MENEFYPQLSQGFRQAASRIAKDYQDVTLSPQQKQEKIAIYVRNALVRHIKKWDMTKIFAVIKGETGIETLAKEYADGINLYKIVKEILTKPSMPYQDKIAMFLESVAKKMTYDFSVLIMENGVPNQEKRHVKELIGSGNSALQNELVELGQKLSESESPDNVLREKPVVSEKKSVNDILSSSILSNAFLLKKQKRYAE